MTIKEEIQLYEHKIKEIDKIIEDLEKHPDKPENQEDIKNYTAMADDYRQLVKLMHILELKV
jgi:hypothetical protein